MRSYDKSDIRFELSASENPQITSKIVKLLKGKKLKKFPGGINCTSNLIVHFKEYTYSSLFLYLHFKMSINDDPQRNIDLTADTIIVLGSQAAFFALGWIFFMKQLFRDYEVLLKK